MSKLFSILLLVMWTFYLLSRITQGITKWHQGRQSSAHDNSNDWEIIEPAERDDGSQVEAQLSQREKARRVFGARVHTEASPLEKHIMRGGMLALGILVALTLIVLVPTLVVALR